MADYRSTCPQRTVIKVHHTTKTWLPVTLTCGHTEQINWTARVGSIIGCTECAKTVNLDIYTVDIRHVDNVAYRTYQLLGQAPFMPDRMPESCCFFT